MKNLMKFILRVLFMPFIVPALILTVAAEFACKEPNWDYWEESNKSLIGMLPWAKYK